MQAEFNNLQSDWLNQAEELNDNEAAQVNGGMQISSSSASSLRAGGVRQPTMEIIGPSSAS